MKRLLTFLISLQLVACNLQPDIAVQPNNTPALPTAYLAPTETEAVVPEETPTQEAIIPGIDRPALVMLLGDSIFSGGLVPQMVSRAMQEAGYRTALIGSQIGLGEDETLHEGHGGFTTTEIVRDLYDLDGDEYWNNYGSRGWTLTQEWTAENIPDVLVILLGTNDLASMSIPIGNPNPEAGHVPGYDYSCMDNLFLIINFFRWVNPEISIIFSPIPPTRRYWNDQVPAYNQALAALAQNLSTEQSLVQYAGDVNEFQLHHLEDGVHPSTEGQRILADNIVEALMEVVP